jgi:hypothetical protein
VWEDLSNSAYVGTLLRSFSARTLAVHRVPQGGGSGSGWQTVQNQSLPFFKITSSRCPPLPLIILLFSGLPGLKPRLRWDSLGFCFFFFKDYESFLITVLVTHTLICITIQEHTLIREEKQCADNNTLYDKGFRNSLWQKN